MTDPQIAALTTLAAAFVGSMGGLLANVLAYRQSMATMRSQEKRELIRLGYELGIKEWEVQIKYALEHGGEVEGHFRKVAKEVEQALFKKAMPPRPSDPAERIGYELRQQEIRSELRKLDAQQRLTVYLTSTDPEVLDAIEMAPPALVKLAPGAQPVFQPFLDQAKKAVAMVERARVLAPEKAAQLDAFNSLAEVYALAVGGLRGEILAAVPSAQPEAIRVAKAG